MTLFDDHPTYDPYRSLKDVTPALPPLEGEDVYGLQCAINEILNLSYEDGTALMTDGSLGRKTGKGIWRVQSYLGVVEDGKAGEETMTAIVLNLLGRILKPWTTRYLLVQGILIKESGAWRIGDYSDERPDGFYDAGIAQMNLEHNDPAEAFNPVQAIAKLVANTLTALDSYEDRSKFVGDDHSRRRRLALAAGHWNAPAYTNWLAGVEPNAKPGQAAREAIERYMEQATILV